MRLPGQYADNTGFYHNGFRDYDPAIGRYLESDPIGLAGGQVSTYAYAGSNPGRFVDSSGLDLHVVVPVGRLAQATSLPAAGECVSQVAGDMTPLPEPGQPSMYGPGTIYITDGPEWGDKFGNYSNWLGAGAIITDIALIPILPEVLGGLAITAEITAFALDPSARKAVDDTIDFAIDKTPIRPLYDILKVVPTKIPSQRE